MDYRQKEKTKLKSDSSLTVGDVTSINLTRIYVISIVMIILNNNNDSCLNRFH